MKTIKQKKSMMVLLIVGITINLTLGNAAFQMSFSETDLGGGVAKDLSDASSIVATKWPEGEGHPLACSETMHYSTLFDVTNEHCTSDSVRNSSSPQIDVLVNSSIYNEIQSSLEQYKKDIEALGYNVSIYSGSWGTPEDVRSFLQGELSNGLIGCLLVGDIPEAWYEMYSDPSSGFPPYEEFPMDLFYMDLDGNWTDFNDNGLYDMHNGTTAPEIWVGRLKASTISNDEVSLIKNYFNKIHKYRTRNITLPQRALSYIDDDWVDWADDWNSNVSLLYNNTTLVKNKTTTCRNDYRDIRLTENYEWFHVALHSSSYEHFFKVNDEYERDDNGDYATVTSYNISTINPHCLFYNLYCCSAARYTDPNYLGGNYTFADTYGICVVGSTKTGSMLHLGEFYGPLGQNKTLGEAFKEWFTVWGEDDPKWSYGMVILGDPMLKLNYPPISPTNLTANIWENNITLNWTASTSSDIDCYNIYIATTIDGFNFESPFDSTTCTTWNHTNAATDLNNYFYIVRGVDHDDKVEENTNKVGKFVKYLEKGRQLISIPFVQSDTDITKVLQTIEGSYSYVQWYNAFDTTDHWKTYSIDKSSSFNDLLNVDHKIALWITMTSPDNLIVAGKVPENTTIQLYKGWNFASYASFIERNVTEALTSIPWEQVEGFDDAGAPYYLKILNDTDIMKVGCGYWIKVSDDCIWTLEN